MIVGNLMKLGLSEYEARVYAASVALGPAKARQIHEVSEVPRSRVYDVLDSLVARGIMNVTPSQPRVYCAVPPEATVEQLRDEYLNAGRNVIERLESLSVDRQPAYEPVWTVRGQRNIRNTIDQIIDSAAETIHFGFNDPDNIKPHLNRLRISGQRGVDIKGIVIGPPDRVPTNITKSIHIRPLDLESAGVFEKLLYNQYSDDPGDERVPIKILLVVVVDGRMSLFVYKDASEEILATLLTIPFFSMFQRLFLEHMYEVSK